MRKRDSVQHSLCLTRVREPHPPRHAAQIGGMTCSSCSNAVETALKRVPGVRHAHVALVTQEARVEYDPSLVQEVLCASLTLTHTHWIWKTDHSIDYSAKYPADHSSSLITLIKYSTDHSTDHPTNSLLITSVSHRLGSVLASILIADKCHEPLMEGVTP